MTERVCVIVNPAAGRGRGLKMIPALTDAFGSVGVHDIRLTSQAGNERDIAERAIADGCTTLVAVGGDGTSANVANALLYGGRHVRLAVMPAGTGNDFAKVLGTDKMSMTELVRLCVEPSDSRIDVGRIEDNYFLNCCGFGFDVAVLQELEKTRWLRGSSVYIWAALKQLFSYRGIEIGIGPGEGSRASIHMMLVIANAPNFGGTFRIAPGASVTDGKLDAVSILDLPAGRRMSMLAAAINGTHERFAEVVTSESDTYDVTFGSAPWYETDGELHLARTPSLRVIACPRALRVVAAR